MPVAARNLEAAPVDRDSAVTPARASRKTVLVKASLNASLPGSTGCWPAARLSTEMGQKFIQRIDDRRDRARYRSRDDGPNV
jgi:hypothetical protein